MFLAFRGYAVCVKVVDDIKAAFGTLAAESPKGKKIDLAEKALTKHCGLKSLSAKDHKLVRPRVEARSYHLCWGC